MLPRQFCFRAKLRGTWLTQLDDQGDGGAALQPYDSGPNLARPLYTPVTSWLGATRIA